MTRVFKTEEMLDAAKSLLDLYHEYLKWRSMIQDTGSVRGYLSPIPDLPEFMAWMESQLSKAVVE